MGINAYFTYSVVITQGVKPEIALGAIFWSGVFFVVISALNIRTAIIKAIPVTVRYAGAVGIGFFIAVIGLHNSGFIVAKAPLLGVGTINAITLVFLSGLFITIIFVVKKLKGAMILGMVVTTLLAWPIGRWFGDAATINHGVKSLINYSGVYAAPNFSWFLKADILGSLKYSYIPIIFALFFVDMFESITTFVGVAEAGNLKDENGDPKYIKQSMIVDGFATLLGGVFGTSPGTAYIESATGIHEGGRTGLTAIVTGPFTFVFLRWPSSYQRL